MSKESKKVTQDELTELRTATKGFHNAERDLAAVAAAEDNIKQRKISAIANYSIQRNILDETQAKITEAYGSNVQVDLNDGTIISVNAGNS